MWTSGTILHVTVITLDLPTSLTGGTIFNVGSGCSTRSLDSFWGLKLGIENITECLSQEHYLRNLNVHSHLCHTDAVWNSVKLFLTEMTENYTLDSEARF